jgi:hypothetical protein
MVYGQVIEGSPKEVAEKLTAMVGDGRVKVMLVEDSSVSTTQPRTEDEIRVALAEFDEMAVRVGHVDDSREAIYTRLEGE